MKIVYDADQPAHKRVVIHNDDGTQTICGAFWLQIETTIDGKPRGKLSFKRWGTSKERESRHQAIARSLANA